MTSEQAQAWLDAYIAAWRSNDATRIGALFSDDARYRFVPWLEPVVGRDAIVAAWHNDFEEDDPWSALYRPLDVSGDLVLATGRTTYHREPLVFENLFVLQFDDEGRCTDFTDWYMKHPSAEIDGA